jgi:GNAT superfamily N-acetyltransferase
MVEISTRHAALADAVQVASVHRLSRADYYGVSPAGDDDREAMWTSFLGQPRRTTYVAEAAGDLVGFMSAHHLTDTVLELAALYVLPSMYGQGVGTRLHDLFNGERGHGTSGALEVWAGNRRAIDFYRRRGWAVTATTRPGPQDLAFVTYQLPAHA